MMSATTPQIAGVAPSPVSRRQGEPRTKPSALFSAHCSSKNNAPRVFLPRATASRTAASVALSRCRIRRATCSAHRDAVVLSSAAHEEKSGFNVYAALDAGWGSIALLAATVLSLYLANSGVAHSWLHLWETHVGPSQLGLHLSLREWVNEGLMAIFFFVVGVDIKKEFVYGSLASIRKAILPCLGALGGMVVPMVVYTMLNGAARVGASSLGWAVPMATDIAFAMGVFGFFRSRMPPGAEAFLLTLATVDDLGAIAVIAVFFAKALTLPYLTAAVALCAGLWFMSKKATQDQLPAYALAGVALWYCLLRGGINADIAGVATAMALPAPPPSGNAHEETLLDRLHHVLAPWTAFLIMPIFALANTAVPFASTSAVALLGAPVAQGIALGLVFGKPLGIVAFSMIGIRLGWATWPTGMMLKHLLVVGVLGGIGFTMSLFLIGCSFAQLPALAASAKLAVLSGSVMAAVLGCVMMAMFPTQQDQSGSKAQPAVA